MVPASGASRRLINLRMVLLPAPLRPTKASVSPDGTEKDTPSRMRRPGREKVTELNSMAAAATHRLYPPLPRSAGHPRRPVHARSHRTRERSGETRTAPMARFRGAARKDPIDRVTEASRPRRQSGRPIPSPPRAACRASAECSSPGHAGRSYGAPCSLCSQPLNSVENIWGSSPMSWIRPSSDV